MARTRTQPTARTARRQRQLLEQFAAAPAGSPLKVDREKGVIYGVKVLGRYSRNSHGEKVTGTEYSPGCMDDAVGRRLYEGQKVKANHPPDRKKPGAERDVYDSLGVLRDVRRGAGPDGEPGLYADLHYLKAHPLAESVCEDVERGLGVYGLSHNASAGRERIDRGTGRLVIESLAAVRSVDLVDKPATNRNLWESEHPMTTTRRSLLEAVQPTLTEPRKKWLSWLLEDDMMAAPPAMEDAPADDAEPEDKLWAGICDAISTILDKKKGGELDAAGAGKAITKYLKAHEKLTGEDDPEDSPEDLEEDEEDDADKDKPKDKPKDVEESVELAQLRAEKKARELCESLDFAPTAVQLEAVAALPEAKRKPLIESFKSGAKPAAGSKPRSPGLAPKKPAARPVVESADPESDLSFLRG